MLTSSQRQHLLEAYQAALGVVGGRVCVREYLRRHHQVGFSHLAAVGKAAVHMSAGALDVLSDELRSALIITKRGYAESLWPERAGFRLIESAHPVPDDSSLRAGAELMDFVRDVPADAGLLFLTSGGASSLVEVLPEGVPPERLSEINRWLLGSGLPIGDMNRIRKRVSQIKAGRLAAAFSGRRALNLMISDVPGDDPKVIGSGLLVAHEPADTSVDALQLPDWLQSIAARAPALPERGRFGHIRAEVVAAPKPARDAAGEALERAGYRVTLHPELLEGEAMMVGKWVAETLSQAPPGAHVWASETTVVLPDSPGRGGRCQSLALSAAIQIAGRQDLWLLAAGTDGTDGPGEDAGALVDGGTIPRGETTGLDAGECLAAADAGRFLDQSGDLVNTGPTGTNVMDLIIGLKSD